MRTEDGSIIRECLNGKPWAFGVLVDKYKAGIYAFVYAELRNFHDAEDVTQEVFLQAYRGLRSLRRWESFSFWLYRIALNLCKKWIRTQSRRPDSEFIEDQDPGMLQVPSADFHREDPVNESLREALDSLPRIYREVIMLHYFGGMDTRDIAEATGTSPSTVRKRLSRARAQLKEEMIAMMGTAFEEQRLQASFTFRIMEAAKRVGIDPVPRTAGLPWGISLAAGVIIAILSFGSRLDLPDLMKHPMSSELSGEMVATELREMPVEVLSISRAPVSFGRQSNGYGSDFQLSNQQNATLTAPRGEGGEFPEEPLVQLGKGTIQNIVYSPDGKILAAAGSLGIWLYDTDNLGEIELLKEDPYRAIAISPDGKLMASSGYWEDEIYLWDFSNREQIGTLVGHANSIYFLAFSPDGESLASGSSDNTVRLWDVAEQKQIGFFNIDKALYTVAISPDWEILASGGGEENEIRLWSIQEQRQIGLLKGHTDGVLSIAFNPDGKILASGSNDRTIRIWDVGEQKQTGLLENDWGSPVIFSPDGKILVSCADERTIRLWDVDEQMPIGTLEGSTNLAYPKIFSPDGKTLVSTDGGSAIRFWDVQGQKQAGIIDGFTRTSELLSYSLAFSPDGKMLASKSWDTVNFWDVQEQKTMGRLEEDSVGWYLGLNSIAFSPDGKILASINGKEIYLYDIQTQERTGILKGHTMTISSIAFTPDGKILVSSGNQDRTVRLWDVAEQKELGVLGNDSWAHTVAISPDGKTIAAAIGDERLIRLWDTNTQKEIGVLEDPAAAAFSVAFSPDGETIASCNQHGIIRIWDYKKQRLIDEFQAPIDSRIIIFSPDGKWLVSLWDDGIALVWDVAEQEEIFAIEGHNRGVRTVAFSPDGKWLASAGYEGTILLWEVDLTVPGWSVEPTGKLPATWGQVKKTELLQNFPNPLNPETWIPFTLSVPEHVKIRIYTSAGQLVRTLDLGQKPPGAYLSKEKAAYWDGTNQSGETAASDVYFYVMEAGGHIGLKKMVLAR